MSSRTYLSGAVRVQRKISIELSAKQWNFYDDPSAETTTKFINRQLEVMFHNVDNQVEAMRQGREILSRYTKIGAMDSEPIGILRRLTEIMFEDAD